MSQSKNKLLSVKVITSSISVTMSLSLVLFVVGLIALIIVNAQRLTDHVKENIGFTIMLENEITEIESIKFQKELDASNFVKSTAFITKEQATEQLKEDLGEDFVEFIGYSPLLSSIDVKINAEYANSDSLVRLSKELNEKPIVFEAYYRKDLIDKLNSNVAKISYFLLIFCILLFIIAFALINNTIRLSVYSKRFLIRTMRLVGATDRFIQAPMISKASYQGFYSSIFAIFMLIGAIQFIQSNSSNSLNIEDLKTIGIVFLIIFIFGILLSVSSTYFAVKKYIKLNENELYN